MATAIPQEPWRHPWLATLCILLLLVAIVGAFVFVPQNVQNLVSRPNPAGSYAEAVTRIRALQAAEGSAFNPVCRTQFMTHGRKTDRVIVFIHGYTSCPEQFRPLGEQFFALGYNVLIAPLPHHGLADRMTVEQSQFTAEEAARYADTVTDIARGLGDHIVMMGLSGGGVTTAWAAQNRSDIDLAVVIAPAFGYYPVPTPLTAAATNYYLAIPNSYAWWDNQLKANGGHPYSYPRYSTWTLAELLRLGFSVQASAQRTPPAARAIIVVTNANDTDVNNVMTRKVAGYWRDRGAALQTFEFDAALKLGHDLIDPNQTNQRVDIVYPQLIRLVTR